MMEEKELKGVIQMLNSTVKMAEHASMTGAMAKGQKIGIRQYNAVLKRLEDTDTIPQGVFIPLEEEASFDDLGVCCNQLVAYLEGVIGKPTDETKGRFSGPFINLSGVGEHGMEELGEMIRRAMPRFGRQVERKIGRIRKGPKLNMNELESRMAELGAQMQVLAERMHREELSGDEIRKMANQIRRLGQRQAKLARQHATVRIHKDVEKPTNQNDS